MCQFPISAYPTDPSQTPRIRLIYLHIPHINTCDTTTHHNAPAMRTKQPAGKAIYTRPILLAAMAFRPHAALAPRAAVRPRRAPAGRSLALRVDMRMERVEGGRVCLTDIACQSCDSMRLGLSVRGGLLTGILCQALEGGGWRRVAEGPGQEGGGARGRGQSRGRSEAPRGVSSSGNPTPRAPAPSRRAPGSARISNKQLNSISRAGSVEAILDIVDEHHKTFNNINVATAVTRIAKLARQQRRSGGSDAATQGAPLASDERYAKLLGLVVQELQSFEPRHVSNVFSGLATLQTECGVTAEADLLVLLGATMERVAPDMNAQNIANTLSAYSKLEEAAAEMPRSLRGALAQAAERVPPDMNAQEVANTLNAYSKLEEAAAEMPRSLRDVLAEAAERVAPDMTAQHVANTLNAYSKWRRISALPFYLMT